MAAANLNQVRALLVEPRPALAANYLESLSSLDSMVVTHRLSLDEALNDAADLVLLALPNGISLPASAAVRRSWPVARLLLFSFREERLWSPAVDALRADDCLLARIPEETLRSRVVQAIQRNVVHKPELFSPTVDKRLSLYQPAGRARWQGRNVSLSLTSFSLLEALVTSPSGCGVESLQRVFGWPVGRLSLAAAIKQLQLDFLAVDACFDAIRLLPGVGYCWHSASDILMRSEEHSTLGLAPETGCDAEVGL